MVCQTGRAGQVSGHCSWGGRWGGRERAGACLFLPVGCRGGDRWQGEGEGGGVVRQVRLCIQAWAGAMVCVQAPVCVKVRCSKANPQAGVTGEILDQKGQGKASM